MKEDILEQLADDYLKSRGYFTQHNIKFKPIEGDPGYNKKSDAVCSDIDILAINTTLNNNKRVIAISCKSTQAGIDINYLNKAFKNEKMKLGGRPAWKSFRELVKEKWGIAFNREVNSKTGETTFTYMLIVTKVIGDRKIWENNKIFLENLKCESIEIKTVSDILAEMMPNIQSTPASSQIGRLLQVIKASDWEHKSNRTDKFLLGMVEILPDLLRILNDTKVLKKLAKLKELYEI